MNNFKENNLKEKRPGRLISRVMHFIVPEPIRRYTAKTRLATLVHIYWNKRIATALIIILIFVGVGITKGFLTQSITHTPQQNIRIVQLISAGGAGSSSSLATTGVVRARTQGDLRIQVPGIVTSVRASVGQYVSAGTIIASVENAMQRAGVAQATAGVAQAKAQLNKIEGGARSEQLAVLKSLTKTALAGKVAARTRAENTLLSAYATTNNTFGGGIDALFITPRGVNPRLLFYSTRSDALLKAQNKRLLLQRTIDREAQMAQKVPGMDTAQLKTEIVQTQKDMRAIASELDSLITALNNGIMSATVPQNALTAYTAMATARRAQVLGTLSALGNTLNGLTASENALTIAKQNEALGVSGAQSEDKTAAKARLDAAYAAQALATAQLEKTRVRAPVSGIIQTLSIRTGDFVRAFQNVGLVANAHALEVQTYLAPQIAQRIVVGEHVLIQNNQKGVVTSIAPAIGVSGQISVRIAIVNKNTTSTSTLTTGERVRVTFSANESGVQSTPRDNTRTNQPITSPSPIIIPITALKLVGNTSSVFTVDTKDILHAQSVTLGAVIQNSIEILSGITPTTQIVRDTRGLSAGDTVIVKVTKK